MFVSQTSPVGVELFSYLRFLLLQKICIDAGHVTENTEWALKLFAAVCCLA